MQMAEMQDETSVFAKMERFELGETRHARWQLRKPRAHFWK